MLPLFVYVDVFEVLKMMRYLAPNQIISFQIMSYLQREAKSHWSAKSICRLSRISEQTWSRVRPRVCLAVKIAYDAENGKHLRALNNLPGQGLKRGKQQRCKRFSTRRWTEFSQGQGSPESDPQQALISSNFHEFPTIRFYTGFPNKGLQGQCCSFEQEAKDAKCRMHQMHSNVLKHVILSLGM